MRADTARKAHKEPEADTAKPGRKANQAWLEGGCLGSWQGNSQLSLLPVRSRMSSSVSLPVRAGGTLRVGQPEPHSFSDANLQCQLDHPLRQTRIGCSQHAGKSTQNSLEPLSASPAWMAVHPLLHPISFLRHSPALPLTA